MDDVNRLKKVRAFEKKKGMIFQTLSNTTKNNSKKLEDPVKRLSNLLALKRDLLFSSHFSGSYGRKFKFATCFFFSIQTQQFPFLSTVTISAPRAELTMEPHCICFLSERKKAHKLRFFAEFGFRIDVSFFLLTKSSSVLGPPPLTSCLANAFFVES